MSRQIDLTQALSDEDREYLVSRGRLEDIRANDEQFGDPGDKFVPIDDGNTGDVDPFKADDGNDQMANMHPGEKPLTEVQGLEVNRGGGSEQADAEDTRDYDEPYTEWSKADLQKEIDERNADEDRDPDAPKIARTGTVQELAGRLTDDDANSE